MALAVPGSIVAATPASAASGFGCEWPRVCFCLYPRDFIDRAPTAAYQDITSSYQTLGAGSRGAAYVYNSRNDDIALIKLQSGAVVCIPPKANGAVGLKAHYGTAVGIRISSAATCPAGT